MICNEMNEEQIGACLTDLCYVPNSDQKSKLLYDIVCKLTQPYVNVGKLLNKVNSVVNSWNNLEKMNKYGKHKKFEIVVTYFENIIYEISVLINYTGPLKLSIIRRRRQSIVRDTLDTILIHNNYLKKISYTSSRSMFVKKFGINKNISNLYIFELENNILAYSKSRDLYQFLKVNNVISIIIIHMILEITHAVISALDDNNECGFTTYKNNEFALFESINVVVNRSLDAEPITNYPTLCYLIYLFSYFVVKYDFWEDTLSNESNVIDKKNNFLIIQKSVINTVVEIFNTILLVNVDEVEPHEKEFYKILHGKFEDKIKMFKNSLSDNQIAKISLNIAKRAVVENCVVDKNKTVHENLIVGGNPIVDGNLTVGGNPIVNKNQIVDENPIVDENQIVNENLIINENLTVNENVQTLDNVIDESTIVNNDDKTNDDSVIISNDQDMKSLDIMKIHDQLKQWKTQITLWESALELKQNNDCTST